MSSLIEYICDDIGQVGELLPAFHSCSGLTGQRIFKSGLLDAKMCKVFNKELLYFFYGKPAYHVPTNGLPNKTMVYQCPVCFVVNMNKIKPYNMYPFDTGAFMGGLYNCFSIQANEKELQQEYCLGDEKDTLSAYVKSFFADNDHYLVGECAKRVWDRKVVSGVNADTKRIDEIEPSIINLLHMLNCDGEFNIDERSRTVEIICDKGIAITNSVEHIILPGSLMDDKNVKGFFDKNKAVSYDTYCFRALTTPEYYYEAVFQKAMEYIKAKRGK